MIFMYLIDFQSGRKDRNIFCFGQQAILFLNQY